MKFTAPQRKLLLKIRVNPPGKRLVLKGGEWIAARTLKAKGCLASTYPIPALTHTGTVAADFEKLKRDALRIRRERL